MIIISILFSLLLCVAISYCYFHQPEKQFYATNGITAPIPLAPLDTPNYSSNPLLPTHLKQNTLQRALMAALLL